jgi:hypothetical protein
MTHRNLLLSCTALATLALIASSCSKDNDRNPYPSAPTALQPAVGDCIYGSSSTVALAPTGEQIDFSDKYPDMSERTDAHTGIFYFVWQGAHGYDLPADTNGEILPPKATDTKSPYDISVLELGSNDPQLLNYGPRGAHHYWGKPYLDYYVGNDEWVMRKHAAMLAGAGVDVIFVDVTNGYAYISTMKVLCDTYLSMRRQGNPTPQIAFMANTRPGDAIEDVFNSLYSVAAYDELWYRWEGKPLMLAPPGNYGAAQNYFTFRHAWFDVEEPNGWFGDGNGKWTWGDYYPQAVGNGEQMSVSVATHAHMNIGRSFVADENRSGVQPAVVTTQMSGEGTYFKKQFDRAIEVDPKFIFLTGWNEWVAQRQVNSPSVVSGTFLGKNIGLGDTYFVDCYNHEFSRDLEPMEGGFGDNYYYYMVDYLRRYKGVERIEPVSAHSEIAVDGKFDDWKGVESWYRDNIGDVSDRDHHGFGWSNRSLTNTSGRNDIVWSKVAADGRTLYFYVQTAQRMTSFSDPLWMRLFISVVGSEANSWEGFQFLVNNGVKSSSLTSISTATGEGRGWDMAQDISYKVVGNEMELAVPLSQLGITTPDNFTVDFKWVDNSISQGDIMECLRNGDAAPDARFKYRYIFHR